MKTKQNGSEKKPGNQHGVRSKYCARVAYVTECGEEGPTQQHFKDQCDINRIANMVEARGSADHVKAARARFGDFSDILDTGVNLEKAAKANELFQHVDVELRKKVGNSIPGLFDWLADPANKDEAIKRGIFDPPAESPAPQSDSKGNIKTPVIKADE